MQSTSNLLFYVLRLCFAWLFVMFVVITCWNMLLLTYYHWVVYQSCSMLGYGVWRHFQQYFSYIVAGSFVGGGKRSTLVTKLKKRSVRTYFLERCIGGHKANNFWHTVKPFLSKKSTGCQQKIVLMENDVILNDKKDVCDTFNSFFYKCCKWYW